MLRTRLQPQLDLIIKRPLTLVSAPAGYGKSTTLSAWVEQQDVDCAWLSLDEDDNDLAQFLAYFLAAARRAIPGFGDHLLQMVRPSGVASVSAFLSGLDEELDQAGRHLVMVLDDFQTIRHSPVLDLINDRMRHPHPLLHLVLLTRRDPGLQLAHWRARNQLVDIRSVSLRFGLDETAEFLQKASKQPPSAMLVESLLAYTEGWPAALRLAALSHIQEPKGPDDGFSRPKIDRDVMSYLANQVLARLSPAKQAFLLQSSILDHFSDSLCEAVVRVDDAAVDGKAMLDELMRDGLFLTALGQNGGWFRYHHLFRDFLRDRLSAEYPPQAIDDLHLRASRWFAGEHYFEDAIRHAMAAGDEQAAVEIVATHRPHLMLEDRWHQLETWFRLFPEKTVAGSPDLLLIQGWAAHFRRFDAQEVKRVSSQISELLRHGDLDPSRRCQLVSENDILRALVHYFELEPSASVELCRQALQCLNREQYIARAYAWLFWSAGLQMSGDLYGALDVIHEGQREDLSYQDENRARSILGAAFVHWIAADLEGVQHVGESLLLMTSLEQQPETFVWAHYFIASALYHRNQLDEALHHAEFTFGRRFGVHAHCAIQSGYIIASIHVAKGDHDRAAETLAAMTEYALAVHSEPLTALLEAMRADLALRSGQVNEAAHWARQALGRLTLAAQPLFYSRFLTIPKTLLALNNPANHPELHHCLRQLHETFESTHNTRFLMETLALEALYHDALGDEQASCELLQRSLALAAPSNFIRVYVDLGPRMKNLLARYARHAAPDEFVDRVRAAFQPAIMPASNETMIEPLTDRECDVLELLAKRLSNKEIAQDLVIADATVKRHTINIYQKLGVRGRREAVAHAQALGLLE